MGYPASGKEGLYRNHIDEVERFFNTRHAGHFRVYNLCCERMYPPERFDGNSRRYPFHDHNACPIELIHAFCEDATAFLAEDAANVVAVHCKAGKGRTGLMCAALLIRLGEQASASDALAFFAGVRTDDGKGVSIPSQKRYVSYFEQVRKLAGSTPPSGSRTLDRLVMHTAPSFDIGGGCDPYVIVQDGRTLEVLFKSEVYPLHVRGADVTTIELGGLVVHGDIKFVLMDKDMTSDDTMCWFWCSPLLEGDCMTLSQADCDGANKDKKNRHFDPAFRVEVFFGPISSAVAGDRQSFIVLDAPLGDPEADDAADE